MNTYSLGDNPSSVHVYTITSDYFSNHTCTYIVPGGTHYQYILMCSHTITMTNSHSILHGYLRPSDVTLYSSVLF